MRHNSKCTLAAGFTLWEKMYAQSTFIGMGVAGAIGIWLVDWRWAMIYLLIFVYAILGVVMRHLNCPRCPHLHVYNDCLQLPTRITKWLVKGRKMHPFSTVERLLFYAIFLLIPLLPLYWLLSTPALLIVFLTTAALWYSGQFLYFCKRCRVQDCPFNRAAAVQ
jgi:MFS family permease